MGSAVVVVDAGGAWDGSLVRDVPGDDVFGGSWAAHHEDSSSSSSGSSSSSFRPGGRTIVFVREGPFVPLGLSVIGIVPVGLPVIGAVVPVCCSEPGVQVRVGQAHSVVVGFGGPQLMVR